MTCVTKYKIYMLSWAGEAFNLVNHLALCIKHKVVRNGNIWKKGFFTADKQFTSNWARPDDHWIKGLMLIELS